MANPYLFAVQDPKVKGLLIFSVVSLSLIFPLIAVLMMKGLGLIQSIEMEDKKERIGPMIAAAVFYMWLFINFKNNSYVPDALKFLILGSTISLCLAFVINTMTKISLHTVGIGGLLVGFIIIRFNFLYQTFAVELFGQLWEIQSNVILIVLMIIAGLVGSARLYLGAHKNDEVYGGYFIGAASMILSFLFLLR